MESKQEIVYFNSEWLLKYPPLGTVMAGNKELVKWLKSLLINATMAGETTHFPSRARESETFNKNYSK
jgi:hypothetical protein